MILEELPQGSILSKSPLKKADVIRKLNSKDVTTLTDLTNIYQEINWMGHAEVEIYRNQQTLKLEVSFK